METFTLNYILKFAEREDFFFTVVQHQLRSLWTAWCILNNWEPDTLQYDNAIRELYDVVLKNSTCPDFWKDDGDVVGFEVFDDFMATHLC